MVLVALCDFAGERVPEEADAGSRAVWSRRERRDEEDARRPRQTRRGNLPARGQGQERLHLPRGVQRTQARRALKDYCTRLRPSIHTHIYTQHRFTYT